MKFLHWDCQSFEESRRANKLIAGSHLNFTCATIGIFARLMRDHRAICAFITVDTKQLA